MNKQTKKQFPQGYYSSTTAQFKLNTPQFKINTSQTSYKNATSAQLGLLNQYRQSKRPDLLKNTSNIVDMIPKEDYQYKRLSPEKSNKNRDFLAHSVDLSRSKVSVYRESSFDQFQNKTSATGFYSKPQVPISKTRLTEGNNSIRVLMPGNNLQQILSKYEYQHQPNPITGEGVKINHRQGINCVLSKPKQQMDQILYQDRDVYGRKQWFNNRV